MTIHGQFRDNQNRLIDVTIESSKGDEQITVGENGLFFGDTPVTVGYDIDDTFEHIIRKSAQINFVTKNYLGDKLFADNARDITVTIKRSTTVLFFGYVDPNTFNQPFVAGLDEFSINCIDYLSTLQYYKYRNATILNYDSLKSTSSIVTFKSILQNIFSGYTVVYDGSKTISTNKNIFAETSIDELNMYESDYDSIWTQEETLNNILQYFNLHIIQEGKTFYIFDWQTIKSKSTAKWVNVNTNANVTRSIKSVTINQSKFGDSDTNISIADVFNQVSVECPLNSQDTLIVSPLEKNNLSSLYSGKQLYMTEYISEGSGDDANKAINNIVNGRPTDYKEAKEYNWYLQLKTNPNWKLYINGTDTIESIYEQNTNGEYINQWKVPKYLAEHQCTPAIISLGNVEIKGSQVQDNSPVSKIDMNNYLYVSVNGNEVDKENEQSPTVSTLQNKSPLIEYIGKTSGGIYSPTDDDTINYFVFSGRIMLQPLVYESSNTIASKQNNFETIRQNGCRKSEGQTANVPKYDSHIPWDSIPVPIWNNLVKSDNNSEGRYYTRKFYTVEKPSDTPSSYLTDGTFGVQPWTNDKSAKGYDYNYTSEGDGTDKFSKVPIFECELIIGNKRLIETNIDMYGNSTFKWVELGSEPTETIDGITYTKKTFSLGINPKIDDFIIGQEYDIQNTINYTMNVDAEGTAIPIKKSDNLSGQVTFRILGLVNTTWNDITRRHPTWFRHTTWNSYTKFILAHTQNVIIKDFECKIYSNNTLSDNEGNDTLVYVSAENDRFINEQDFEFAFITQPTSKECVKKGIKTAVNLNAVVNATTSLNLQNITFGGETAKAEEHYINQYYNEYCSPKIILETTLHDNNEIFCSVYSWSYLGKSFIPLSIQKDIKYNKATVKLKEV